MTRVLPDDLRIVITGAGPIASIGIGRADFAAGIRESRPGIGPSERLSDMGPFSAVAECWDFAIEDYVESKKTYIDRCSALAIASCALAITDAGLEGSAMPCQRLGIALGTAFGCVESMTNQTARVQTKGLRFGSPMIFTHTMPNAPTALAAIEYQLQGPAATFFSGDISAAIALDFACRRLRTSEADCMLAGGADGICSALLSGLASEVYPTPGEGACMFILETLDHARKRDANILCELLGIGMAADIDTAEEAAAMHAALTPTPARYQTSGRFGHTFAASLPLTICEAIASSDNASWCFAVSGGASACVIAGRQP